MLNDQMIALILTQREQQLAIFQTARIAYACALSDELPKKETH